MPFKESIHILLADDDKDDHLFFMEALSELFIASEVKIIEDGEDLVRHLSDAGKFPDILFLDYNMPRKNGLECIKEINSTFGSVPFPLIIYSTFINQSLADDLYNSGAYHYMQKCEFHELVKNLSVILSKLQKNDLTRPLRDDFVVKAEVI